MYVLVAVALAVAALLAYVNPQRIAVDIGVARLDAVPASVAFTVAFAFGWLFGLACAAGALLRGAAERRRLGRRLRVAESEAHALRNLPVHDAD